MSLQKQKDPEEEAGVPVESPFYQKPQKSLREVRTHIHAEIQATVRYRVPSKEEEILVQVFITDISEKGALFITPKEAIPLEAEVRATFPLPGLAHELPLSIVGKARRTKHLEGGKCGTGIEFTEVSGSGLKALRSFIALQQLDETF